MGFKLFGFWVMSELDERAQGLKEGLGYWVLDFGVLGLGHWV